MSADKTAVIPDKNALVEAVKRLSDLLTQALDELNRMDEPAMDDFDSMNQKPCSDRVPLIR